MEVQQAMQNNLFMALLNAWPGAVQVLEAMRDINNNVTDFTYVFSNNDADKFTGKNQQGKKLQTDFSNVEADKLFAKYLAALQRNEPQYFTHSLRTADGIKWFDYTVQKFGDGVLVSYNDVTLRERSEQQLLENKQLLQSIINAPNIGIGVFRAVRNDEHIIEDFRFEYVNERTLKAFGNDNPTGKLLTTYGSDGAQQLDYFKEVIEKGKKNSYIRKAAFGIVYGWFLFSNAPLGGDRLVQVWEDITEIKDVQKEAVENKTLLQSVLNNTASNIMLLRPVRNEHNIITDFEYIYTNEQTLISLNKTTLQGKRILEEFPDTANSDLINQCIAVIETGRSFQSQLDISPFGAPVWAQVYARKMGDDLLVTYFDITSNKKSEQEILDLKDAMALKVEDEYRILFNSIDEGYCIIKMLYDENGKPDNWMFLEVNPAMEKHNGLLNATGKRIKELTPAIEQKWMDIYHHVAETGQSIRFVEDSPALDRVFDLYAFRVGEPVERKVAVLFTDITARKQTEDALRRNEERTKCLNEAYKAVVNGADLAAALHILSRLAINEMNDEARTAFYMADETLSHLYTVRGAGTMQEGYADAIDGFKIGTDSLACGLAIPLGKPVITPDVQEEPSWSNRKQLATQFDFRACWSFPIKTRDDKTVGTFAMYFNTPRPATEKEMELAAVITQAAAVIIANHKETEKSKLAEEALREAEAKHLEELEAKVAIRTRELKEQEYLLRSVFHTTLVGMAVHEAVLNDENEIVDFHIKIVNRQLEILTGRTDLEGKLYAEEYPGIKTSGVFDIMKEVVETGKPQQLEYFYEHDGFKRHFLSMFVKFDGGLVATNLDITDRKMNENQLKDQAAYIARITETVPDMISIVELSTRKYEFINTKTFVAEGFDTETFETKPREELSRMIHPDDQPVLQDFFARFNTMGDDDITYADYRARSTEHENWRWFKVRGRVFKRDAEGRATHGLNVIQNITFQKEAEEKIDILNKKLLHKNRELEAANAGIKTFTSIAANDYKETLKHLYTNLEFIISNEAKKLSDAGKANLRRAQSGIQKMKLLTDDIVNFLKIPSLDNVLTEIDLNEIIKTVITDLTNKIGEANTIIEKEELPVLKGYPLLISLLFYHLLDNAIKFRKENRSNLVWIGYKKMDQINVDGAVPNMAYHRIGIVDDGIGFKSEDAEKIFEIFYKPHQKKYKGSGIGLAICRQIMDIHHGFILAESNESKGASFICFFPADTPVKK